MDLQLLSQCGSNYNCLSKSVPEIHSPVHHHGGPSVSRMTLSVPLICGSGVALQADPGLAEPCAVWALEVRICRWDTGCQIKNQAQSARERRHSPVAGTLSNQPTNKQTPMGGLKDQLQGRKRRDSSMSPFWYPAWSVGISNVGNYLRLLRDRQMACVRSASYHNGTDLLLVTLAMVCTVPVVLSVYKIWLEISHRLPRECSTGTHKSVNTRAKEHKR